MLYCVPHRVQFVYLYYVFVLMCVYVYINFKLEIIDVNYDNAWNRSNSCFHKKNFARSGKKSFLTLLGGRQYGRMWLAINVLYFSVYRLGNYIAIKKGHGHRNVRACVLRIYRKRYVNSWSVRKSSNAHKAQPHCERQSIDYIMSLVMWPRPAARHPISIIQIAWTQNDFKYKLKL